MIVYSDFHHYPLSLNLTISLTLLLVYASNVEVRIIVTMVFNQLSTLIVYASNVEVRVIVTMVFNQLSTLVVINNKSHDQ